MRSLVTDPWTVVEQVQAGGDSADSALAEIYQQYRLILLKYVYRRTNNRELAEDIVQDVFVRALPRFAALEVRAEDPGAWLVTIARNLIIDHYKSARYQRETLVSTEFWADDDRPDQGTDPERSMVTAYTAGAVRAALATLTPEQATAVKLRFFDGLTVEETGRRLGRNPGAVKSLTYRALLALQRHLPAEVAAA